MSRTRPSANTQARHRALEVPSRLPALPRSAGLFNSFPMLRLPVPDAVAGQGDAGSSSAPGRARAAGFVPRSTGLSSLPTGIVLGAASRRDTFQRDPLAVRGKAHPLSAGNGEQTDAEASESEVRRMRRGSSAASARCSAARLTRDWVQRIIASAASRPPGSQRERGLIGRAPSDLIDHHRHRSGHRPVLAPRRLGPDPVEYAVLAAHQDERKRRGGRGRGSAAFRAVDLGELRETELSSATSVPKADLADVGAVTASLDPRRRRPEPSINWSTPPRR